MIKHTKRKQMSLPEILLNMNRLSRERRDVLVLSNLNKGILVNERKRYLYEKADKK